MRLHIRRPALWPVLLSLLIALPPAYGEIYRWQDEKGRWHFGDAKPSGAASETLSDSSTKKGGNQNSSDKNITQKLIDKYGERKDISNVTLSVIAIETKLGSGSGFFISEQGHIITNKHVVRPEETGQLEKTQAKLAEARSLLKRANVFLESEKGRLKNIKTDIERLEKFIASEPERSPDRPLMISKQTELKRIYKLRRKNHEKDLKKYQAQLSELNKREKDINWNSMMSGISNTFKIYLKDDSEYTARLINISSHHDLALLQLDNSQTPALAQTQGARIRQGDKVFAIGSPLGIRDTVTSGIITRIDRQYIYTDAQILPGNSGGPLVNETGEVIGINTQKVAAGSVMNDGFGKAIPLEVALKAFSKYLTK